jgi:hypothetical protein
MKDAAFVCFTMCLALGLIPPVSWAAPASAEAANTDVDASGTETAQGA